MKINHPCWKCEQCGHIWIALSDYPPEKCASSKCRSRQWNKVGTKLSREIKPADVRKLATQPAKSFVAPEIPEPEELKELITEYDE